MTPDCKVSIIVLGDSGVGKSSLLLRYTTNTFKDILPLTMIDCFHKVIKLKDKEVKLDLWDTAGQDRFRAITKQYYRLADGVLLVYDVTNIATFHKLSGWLSELRATNSQAMVIIVGNKNDEESRKKVSVTQIKSYAEQEGIDFVETSAKIGKDVDIIFDFLVTKILQAKGIIPQSASTKQTPPSENTSQVPSSSAATGHQPMVANTNSRTVVQLMTRETATKNSTSNKHLSISEINERTASSETSLNNNADEAVESLAPIVPAPSDCIKLHVNTTIKTKKKKCACA